MTCKYQNEYDIEVLSRVEGFLLAWLAQVGWEQLVEEMKNAEERS